MQEVQNAFIIEDFNKFQFETQCATYCLCSNVFINIDNKKYSWTL